MERLGRNAGGYRGETVEIAAVLSELEAAANAHGWCVEVFHARDGFRWLALRRDTPPQWPEAPCIYLSAGIHGDEPAGPLALLELLRENLWPTGFSFRVCPCLNPPGFALNRRENDAGVDLNRDYRRLQTSEVRAHVEWLRHQPPFGLCLCLHEDWEAKGFYVYEQNPDARPSLAEVIVAAAGRLCPIDLSPVIEGREACHGIIRPNLDPATRPQWPEAFWLIQNKTRQSYTLEAPSDFPLPVRVAALASAARAALHAFAAYQSGPRRG
ncbi:MAG: M14 family metallocarboxypeptidase [Verrucomicrobiales bacterium]|nr:M14 family metallocarboxypeptidase [Verrucomicrobiales bacterium]